MWSVKQGQIARKSPVKEGFVYGKYLEDLISDMKSKYAIFLVSLGKNTPLKSRAKEGEFSFPSTKGGYICSLVVPKIYI